MPKKTSTTRKKKTLQRIYSDKTLKVLFALSGNQCAHPDCNNSIIEAATEHSDAFVSGHICHIYAISEDGPRGALGLTQETLNAPENLVLMCRHHHGIVDGQHETYPAALLLEWKKNHQDKIHKKIAADWASLNPEVISHPYFPRALVDQRIGQELEILIKSRFFAEYDAKSQAMAFGERLIRRELSGGSDEVRCKALAWCARLLTRSNKLEIATEFLNHAKLLGGFEETKIADAFLIAQSTSKAAALQILADLDTAAARSAALMLVSSQDGTLAALNWFQAVGYSINDLDPCGKVSLLQHQLDQAQWDKAKETIHNFRPQDLEAMPVLYHILGITHFLSIVPEEIRRGMLELPPGLAKHFPIASDAIAIQARKSAYQYFIDGVEAARKLNLYRAEQIDDQYVIWLELVDKSTSAIGRSKLESRLRDPRTALAYVSLAVKFDIKLDISKVERDIDIETAKNGEITRDAAIARFALAYTNETPDKVAEYLAKHHEQLSVHLEKRFLIIHQIEMLAKAKQVERANQLYEELKHTEGDGEDLKRVRIIIAEAEGNDPLEAFRQQYVATGALGDLINLNIHLDQKGLWEELDKYALILFEKTKALRDAERYVKALTHLNKLNEIIELLKNHPNFLDDSSNLGLSLAWALYHNGDLIESRQLLSKLDHEIDNPNYGALVVNLAIHLGDWLSLSSYIANEYQRKDKRTPQGLLSTAQLAHQINSPHVRQLIKAAIDKCDDDPIILASAYFLATSAGWEDDPKVFEWLDKATKLSGDEGPLQTISIKEILDNQPDWNRRVSETWGLVAQGNIPMFLAAENLRKSLVDLTVYPAIANRSESDPRRRGMIPAYSGKQSHAIPTLGQSKVSIDVSALLTMSYLGLLDKALSAFETIIIPHSTLAWLFDVKHKAAFHQPSRIKSAHQLLNGIATNSLEKFNPSTVAESELAAQVGDELAALITEAENIADEEKGKRIVVRPAPVHRLSSFMEEKADLTLHQSVLSSCFAIVTKLKQKGQITLDEESRARSFLQLHEEEWPNQPKIIDGAVLYLDDVAVSYFQHLGILDKLHAAGFKAIVSNSEIIEATELITYEGISQKINEVLEIIRSELSQRIETGQIKVAKSNDSEEGYLRNHPLIGVIGMGPICNQAIIDDRFVNQHSQISEGGGQTMIFSTLHLLDALVHSGALNTDTAYQCKTQLRRAGYVFIPVTEDELQQYISTAEVRGDTLVETAELKAIRESILRVRMSDWLQLPKEAEWLDTLQQLFLTTIQKAWEDGATLKRAVAISNWLSDQLDLLGWAHCIAPEHRQDFIQKARASYVRLLFIQPELRVDEMKASYFEWIDHQILLPLKEQFPDTYNWVVTRCRNFISQTTDDLLSHQND